MGEVLQDQLVAKLQEVWVGKGKLGWEGAVDKHPWLGWAAVRVECSCPGDSLRRCYSARACAYSVEFIEAVGVGQLPLKSLPLH